MDQDLLGLAFGAGLVAALNPCGFALLPGYLALVVQAPGRGPVAAVGRSLAATAAMAAGFMTVFGVFGLLTVAAAAAVQRYLPYLTVAVGGGLVALGVWLLLGHELGLLIANPLARTARWAPTARLTSMFGYGLGYAAASLTCTAGPFLAVTGASLRGGGSLGRVSVFIAYTAGFTLIVGVLALAAAVSGTALIERMRRATRYVHRVSGALLVAVGAYVAYYGLYEIRLFTAGGDPADPVIAAAARVQGTLATWAHRYGGWPWLVALAAVLLGVLTCAWHARRGTPSGPATADDGPSRRRSGPPRPVR